MGRALPLGAKEFNYELNNLLVAFDGLIEINKNYFP